MTFKKVEEDYEETVWGGGKPDEYSITWSGGEKEKKTQSRLNGNKKYYNKKRMRKGGSNNREGYWVYIQNEKGEGNVPK